MNDRRRVVLPGDRILPPAPRRNFDDGQFDGDKPRSFGFQGSPRFSGPAGNALGAAIPPWHMWGNTQRIEVVVQSPTNPLVFSPGQLLRIAYKRPETWHWVLSARLIDGPNSTLVDPIIVEVHYDLTIGIGRSMMQIPGGYAYFDQRNDPAFERFQFIWGGPTVGADATFPRGAQIYSTAVQAPGKDFLNGPVPTKSPAIVNEIVAQDIQLNCRVIAITFPAGTPIGGRVTVEVSGHFAPKNHIRPDWFREGTEPQQFQGGEVEGK